jgi:hypothetical protein
MVCWGALNATAPPGPFEEVALAGSFACGLAADGAVRCAGSTSALEPPMGEDGPLPMTTLGAGQGFVCGLDEDAQLHCWGGLNWPSFDLPTGSFSSLAVGWGYVCAERLASGELVCGGTDFTPQPPAGVSLHDVGVGSYFGCGLTDADAIVCFDDEPLTDLEVPGGSFAALGVGDGTACAIRKADAALVCFGNHLDTDVIGSAVPAGRFLQVAVGTAHACAVREDHAVLCFGDDTYDRTAVP